MVTAERALTIHARGMDDLTEIHPFVEEHDVDPDTGEILAEGPDLPDNENDLAEPDPPALLYPRLEVFVEDFLAVI